MAAVAVLAVRWAGAAVAPEAAGAVKAKTGRAAATAARAVRRARRMVRRRARAVEGLVAPALPMALALPLTGPDVKWLVSGSSPARVAILGCAPSPRADCRLPNIGAHFLGLLKGKFPIGRY